MQLAAHARGLATIWRTGPIAYHPYMRGFLGLEGEDMVVAFLYLGYGDDMVERPRKREAALTRTTWYEG